ncbi:DNA polymerase III subunit delta [Rheinheimera sp.]|uniref:DNA polymerase III subunit delta n=1 Tax=Rheinheimera sp. TaxID=1869214 RepID=UPI0027B99DE7|nr:DNA polymerase III subunit delta [Rheinheimera sp.]
MLKLFSNQLPAQLKKGLAPVYLVFGEEPLQKMEALDDIRSAAKAAGFDDRQSFINEAQFDWADFFNEINSMSLFTPRQLLELDLGTAKLTPAAQDQLKKLPALLHADLILVLHGAKTATEFAKQSWFKALAEIGVQVQFYALDDYQFMRWLKERAAALGVKLQTDALQLLQHHAAGNLLAAKQELEKLALTQHGQWLDAAFLQQYLADQSHFSVFQLIDAVLAGQGEEALHRLDRLLAQDNEPVMIGWQLQKEAMLLLQLKTLEQQGVPPQDYFKKFSIWPKRQSLYQQALLRLSNNWLQHLLQELACFDRGLKSGRLPHPEVALAHLVTLFINPVPKLFSLQQQLAD